MAQPHLSLFHSLATCLKDVDKYKYVVFSEMEKAAEEERKNPKFDKGQFYRQIGAKIFDQKRLEGLRAFPNVKLFYENQVITLGTLRGLNETFKKLVIEYLALVGPELGLEFMLK